MSSTVLLPWQHTGFQTSSILKAFLATFDVPFLSNDIIVIACGWHAAFLWINDVVLMSCMIYPLLKVKCNLGASK